MEEIFHDIINNEDKHHHFIYGNIRLDIEKQQLNQAIERSNAIETKIVIIARKEGEYTNKILDKNVAVQKKEEGWKIKTIGYLIIGLFYFFGIFLLIDV